MRNDTDDQRNHLVCGVRAVHRGYSGGDDKEMEDEMSELKRCPFCGNEITGYFTNVTSQVREWDKIELRCTACLSSIRGENIREVTHDWNTRPIEDELRAEIDRRDEIITRLKEVLPTLKISHNYCEDCWYSCPKHEDGCCNEAEGEDCNCGADEHNSKIDALMKELE